MLRVGQAAGLATAAEAFADRVYEADGNAPLAPAWRGRSWRRRRRGRPGRYDRHAGAALTSYDGGKSPCMADTLCIHGDTPRRATIYVACCTRALRGGRGRIGTADSDDPGLMAYDYEYHCGIGDRPRCWLLSRQAVSGFP
jgi:lactam utilization protein B